MEGALELLSRRFSSRCLLQPQAVTDCVLRRRDHQRGSLASSSFVEGSGGIAVVGGLAGSMVGSKSFNRVRQADQPWPRMGFDVPRGKLQLAWRSPDLLSPRSTPASSTGVGRGGWVSRAARTRSARLFGLGAIPADRGRSWASSWLDALLTFCQRDCPLTEAIEGASSRVNKEQVGHHRARGPRVVAALAQFSEVDVMGEILRFLGV